MLAVVFGSFSLTFRAFLPTIEAFPFHKQWESASDAKKLNCKQQNAPTVGKRIFPQFTAAIAENRAALVWRAFLCTLYTHTPEHAFEERSGNKTRFLEARSGFMCSRCPQLPNKRIEVSETASAKTASAIVSVSTMWGRY